MRITIQQIQEMKQRGERIAMLTAYEYSIAKLLDAAGVPMLLVGDSLASVVLGYETTIGATMDDMVRHTQAVVRGTERALIVADLPFMSYQVSAEEALRNAGRLMREGGAGSVKLEGGVTVAETVRRIVDAGVPVMGHIGLTPQSVHQLSGHKVQGRTADVATRLLADAEALEQAGAFGVVLEGIPAPLAAQVTRRLRIPTIGIGAGPECDGQVQVIHDLLGLFTDFVPRHAGQYAQLGLQIKEAVSRYADDVRAGAFPTAKHSFKMDAAVLAEVEQTIQQRDREAIREPEAIS
ncbi:MAG: 3-methyl-2-oxobutanoate hydroxymethyltransferase [Chloroflexota bacterium]